MKPKATATTTETADMRVGDRPSLPASPPAPMSPDEWWDREAERMRAELDAFAAKGSTITGRENWYALQLRRVLLRLYIEHRRGQRPGKPGASPAKPRGQDIGDLIAQAEADPAGDTPPDAL